MRSQAARGKGGEKGRQDEEPGEGRVVHMGGGKVMSGWWDDELMGGWETGNGELMEGGWNDEPRGGGDDGLMWLVEGIAWLIEDLIEDPF